MGPLLAAVNHSYHDEAIRVVAVRALLAAGADPRSPSARGALPLTGAVAAGDVEIVRALMQAHPDLRLGDDFGARVARGLARLRRDAELLTLIGEA